MGRGLFVFVMGSTYKEKKGKQVICGGCDNEINKICVLEGKIILANGKLWHREHFQCDRCKVVLKEFVTHNNNRTVCRDCHITAITPSCSGCDGVLFETFLIADGKKWHSECFKCTKCKCGIPNGKYVTITGKNYDEDCGRKIQLVKQL